MHRSITVKYFGSLFRETFLVILCNPLQKVFALLLLLLLAFLGTKSAREHETGGGGKEEMRKEMKKAGRQSSSIIMEFCYLYFFLNPTRKYKNEKARKIPGKTGMKIKFVNEIYKQGFFREKKSVQMLKIDSVYGLEKVNQ